MELVLSPNLIKLNFLLILYFRNSLLSEAEVEDRYRIRVCSEIGKEGNWRNPQMPSPFNFKSKLMQPFLKLKYFHSQHIYINTSSYSCKRSFDILLAKKPWAQCTSTEVSEQSNCVCKCVNISFCRRRNGSNNHISIWDQT